MLSLARQLDDRRCAEALERAYGEHASRQAIDISIRRDDHAGTCRSPRYEVFAHGGS